ncbi:tyrosine-type recombinase/integrase [Actinomadura flavalba]|uniref:tyrosine-type recombinase/integrase n=1 Tax=Actinomadura flavalba TaxID=1120938 RepID=UPI000373F42E|nr:tyrosine-type recombinase/integrase [Actinomadura flavalba]
MAYTQARPSKTKGVRYVGFYRAADGKIKPAGTFATEDEALRVAEEQERHIRDARDGTPPADKARMTIKQFGTTRFIPRADITPKAKQTYKSHLKNHVYPYLGSLRVAEIARETIYNHLVTTLVREGVSLTTRRAVRTVLSSMLQMAWDEGYRENNPVSTIRLKKVPARRVLVATHAQWNRLEAGMPFPAAKLYARLNVTTWARQCEMRTLRPRDFEFDDSPVINITRSASYVTADNHPDGVAGWVVQPNPKNGDWRRFAISQKTASMVRAHIEEHDIKSDDLLFPQWMFAYRRPSTGVTLIDNEEIPPPIISSTGKAYHHGTMGARFTMDCRCVHCKAFAAWYARQRRARTRDPEAQTRTSVWRQDGTEYLSSDVWTRIWRAARDTVGLPAAFTPYNARHTGISWAVSQGADLGRVRQRAGHGSLEVTSRYQTILDECDPTLADNLDTLFEDAPVR